MPFFERIIMLLNHSIAEFWTFPVLFAQAPALLKIIFFFLKKSSFKKLLGK
jgi:hypothetical protein